jgi:hypothetical protein
MTPTRTLSLLGLLSLAASCSDYRFSKDGTADSAEYGGDWDEADSDTDTDTDADSDSGDIGSEDEDDYLKLQPATTNAYVFVANPDRNTVTRVSVPSLGTITTTVGTNPVAVATTSDYRTAVTFNQDSNDVSIIDAETLTVVTVSVRSNFNALRMSPDGRWVICFNDPGVEDNTGSGGAQSYNEISVVNVETATHTPLVVGFKPHDVQFTEDGSKAVVVSDAWLAVVDLSEDEPTRELVALSDDLVDPPAAEEVLLVPSGNYAFVRQYGASELVLVDLGELTTSSLATGSNPTDLDVTPDGLQAVAVARGSSELWVYDLADPTQNQSVVAMPTSNTFGSVLMSPDGSKGLLYSTQSGESVYADWDRSDDTITVRPLVKPVSAVGVSPTGGTALIFHDKENGDVEKTSDFYDHYALTLVELSTFFPSSLRLPAKATAFASSDDGTTGFFIMEDEPWLEVLHYDTLLYDEIELKSVPVHVGVLPDTTWAYASQEHALGRMSFYDYDNGTLQTITGFELNSGIEH